MKTYWDYTEKERSQFTEDDVRAMLDGELMLNGIIKVNEPTLRPVKEVDIKQTETWYECKGILFRTAEQAGKFLELDPHDDAYLSSLYEYKYAQPISDNEYAARIEPKKMYKREDIERLSKSLSENLEAKKYNESERLKYKKESEKMQKALNGLWEDYYRCQGLARDHKKITDTMEEYRKLTQGDEWLAFTFLKKAFDQDHILDAYKWFELEIPKEPVAEKTAEAQR